MRGSPAAIFRISAAAAHGRSRSWSSSAERTPSSPTSAPPTIDDPQAGAFDFTRVRRSPGSTLKPFVYALAFERGVLKTTDLLNDIPEGASGVINADGTLSWTADAASGARQFAQRAGDQSAAPRRARGEFQLPARTRPARSRNAGGEFRDFHGDRRAADAAGGCDARLCRARRRRRSCAILRSRATKRDVRRGASLSVDTRAADHLDALRSAGAASVLSALRAARISLRRRREDRHQSQAYRDAWTIAFSHKFIVGVWLGRGDAGTMRAMTGVSSARGSPTPCWRSCMTRSPETSRRRLLRRRRDASPSISVAPDGGADCAQTLREWVKPEDADWSQTQHPRPHPESREAASRRMFRKRRSARRQPSRRAFQALLSVRKRIICATLEQ